jgi:hypothetical protein
MATVNRDQQVKLTKAELARLHELLNMQFSVAQATAALGVKESDIRRSLHLSKDQELSPASVMAATIIQLHKLDGRQDITDHTLMRVHRGTTLANTRVAQLERQVRQLTELLGNDAPAALKAGQIGGRKSFINALRQRKYDDDSIRKVLVVVDDTNFDNLSDDQIFAELFDTVGSLRNEVNNLTEEVGKHSEILGEGGEHFAQLREDVTTIQNTYTDLRDDSFSVIGLFVGALVGLIAGILWAWHDFDQTVRVGTAKVLIHSWAEDAWAAWLFGFAVFVIVFGLVSMFASGRQQTTSSTETVTTSEESDDSDHRLSLRERYNNWRANRRDQEQRDREAGSRVIDTASNDSRVHDTVPQDRQEANAR